MTREFPLFWTLISLVGLLVGQASADDPAGYTVSLFDGKTLQGWQVSEGIQVAVEDGAIALKEGNGWLRTDHRYRDFILEIEWKALKEKDWDSGIYIRAEPPKKGNFPSRYQANLKQNLEGNIAAIKGATSTGLTKPGEWNKFKITVIGSTVAMEINGQSAWKVDGLEAADGYVGIQCETPVGGQFLFRNIRLTELGYKSLFNGQDLTGWEGAGAEASACWQVEEGQLVCTGKKGTWLRSLEEHGDLNIRLEYKVKEGGNSGVYLRVPKDGNHHGPGSGVEVQILDDLSPRYTKLQPYQYCGSVYGIAGSQQKTGLPAGSWNRLEINCSGTDYRVTHNGVVIVNAKADEFPGLKERRAKGFLGLQNHSEEVYFRNLRIGPAMQ